MRRPCSEPESADTIAGGRPLHRHAASRRRVAPARACACACRRGSCRNDHLGRQGEITSYTHESGGPGVPAGTPIRGRLTYDDIPDGAGQIVSVGVIQLYNWTDASLGVELEINGQAFAITGEPDTHVQMHLGDGSFGFPSSIVDNVILSVMNGQVVIPPFSNIGYMRELRIAWRDDTAQLLDGDLSLPMGPLEFGALVGTLDGRFSEPGGALRFSATIDDVFAVPEAGSGSLLIGGLGVLAHASRRGAVASPERAGTAS